MATYTSYSTDFFQASAMANDLTAGIPKHLSANSIGFLICDSQVDYHELVRLLEDKIAIPVIGGTTFTDPLAGAKEERSATLTILDLEHLESSIQISEPLEQGLCNEQMKQLYDKCVGNLSTAPKLLMMYMPMIGGLTVDHFITRLISLAGDIPLFGGMNMNDLDSGQAAVFAGGKAYKDRMILIALGGDIRPVFGVGSQMTPMSEYAPAVTESDYNVVYRLDDMSFCDYMRSIGISPEDRRNGVDALVQYGPLPCQLRNKLAEDDGIAELRCISYTNVEAGSAAFSSSLPPGTRVNMGLIQKDDVAESFRACLDTLTQRMQKEEESGYQYSVLFTVPCVARYFAMLGGENLESRLLIDETPKNLAVSAFYGFLEVGPTLGKNGEVHNRSHNASIVMCAL